MADGEKLNGGMGDSRPYKLDRALQAAGMKPDEISDLVDNHPYLLSRFVDQYRSRKPSAGPVRENSGDVSRVMSTL